jgi:phage baseplate assembly protein W
MATTLTKLYSDLDFSFTKTPGRNDIALSYDDMAVVRAVRYLLLTKHYERPFQPNLGSGIEQLLFEPISPITAATLKTEIESVITNHEPRVNLVQVTIDEDIDRNAYSITIEFYIGNNVQTTSVNLILERTR